MAVTVAIELNREIEIAGSYDEVFDLLADIPRSVSYFPKVEKLEELGDGAYRWEMEKVGVDKHAIKTEYACKYYPDRENRKISWEPVPGVGNGTVKGSWTLTPKDDRRTGVTFHTKAELTVPLPSFLKLAISPVIKHEFNGLVDTYMKNLSKAL